MSKTNDVKKSVAIIGAGYTGLVAAYRLAKAGQVVTLYEREPYVAGLVSGFSLDGIAMEKIYHFLYKTDADILSLLEELGIREKLVFHDSSVSTYYDGKIYPFMTPVDILRFTPLSLSNRIRFGVVGLYLQFLNCWEPLTRVTAYDWMLKWSGKEVMDIIWTPLLKGKFSKYYDKIAMSWLWSRIRVRARSKEKGDVVEKLGYFSGGWHIVADRLVEEIQQLGGEIRTGTQIESLRSIPESGKIEIVIGGTPILHDSVIATVPTHVFGRLVENDPLATAEYKSQLASIDYIGAVVMPFVSTQRITSYYWHNINDSRCPFLVFLSLSELAGSGNFGGKHVYYVGAYVSHDHPYFSLEKEAIMDEWKAGLKLMFPDFDASKITAAELFRFKNAQHIVGMGYREKMPAYQTPLPGIYLANFSQIYPDDRGTNYAVRDGNMIADMVLRNLNI